MFCRKCGSNLPDGTNFCPNCGAQTNEPTPVQQPSITPNVTDRSNPIAIVGFVLSFFVTLAGLICSIIGYNKAKNEGRDNGGLALAGIIISIVSMVISFFAVVFYASFWVEFFNLLY